jgi:hypothetical protein
MTTTATMRRARVDLADAFREVVARLGALEAQHREVVARLGLLEARPRRAANGAADLALLHAIAEAAEGHTFTASELLARAGVDAALADALVANTPETLGCWLRGRAHQSLDGLRVVRVGRRWRVEVVECPRA